MMDHGNEGDGSNKNFNEKRDQQTIHNGGDANTINNNNSTDTNNTNIDYNNIDDKLEQLLNSHLEYEDIHNDHFEYFQLNIDNLLNISLSKDLYDHKKKFRAKNATNILCYFTDFIDENKTKSVIDCFLQNINSQSSFNTYQILSRVRPIFIERNLRKYENLAILTKLIGHIHYVGVLQIFKLFFDISSEFLEPHNKCADLLVSYLRKISNYNDIQPFTDWILSIIIRGTWIGSSYQSPVVQFSTYFMSENLREIISILGEDDQLLYYGKVSIINIINHIYTPFNYPSNPSANFNMTPDYTPSHNMAFISKQEKEQFQISDVVKTKYITLLLEKLCILGNQLTEDIFHKSETTESNKNILIDALPHIITSLFSLLKTLNSQTNDIKYNIICTEFISLYPMLISNSYPTFFPYIFDLVYILLTRNSDNLNDFYLKISQYIAPFEHINDNQILQSQSRSTKQLNLYRICIKIKSYFYFKLRIHFNLALVDILDLLYGKCKERAIPCIHLINQTNQLYNFNNDELIEYTKYLYNYDNCRPIEL